MNQQIFKFLKSYSTEPFLVNRLIVSSFISYNRYIPHKNEVLLNNMIGKNEGQESVALEQFEKILMTSNVDFTFESLIELFEFVISPTDKVINGAIYTPKYIREYIIKKQFGLINKNLTNVKCCDISCGCGGFLLSIALFLNNTTGRSFKKIFRDNIFGLDIASYSLERAKLLLSLLALSFGEDDNFEFNLFEGNALSFNWFESVKQIKANGGFDLISGNPPYVTSRNMDEQSLELMSKWSVAKAGHPDLYIPFFQIGYELLNKLGVLGYITVNTFLKSINGRSLRLFFANESPELYLINFGGEQIFKGRNTYTCLCFLKKVPGSIKYYQTDSSNLELVEENIFKNFSYDDFDHIDGWNLTNSTSSDKFIRTIENVGSKLKDLFTTRNGIATLKNDSFKFRPIKESKRYYFFLKDSQEFKIEKEICKDIVNANKIKEQDDLKQLREKIIYPYTVDNGPIEIIPETTMSSKYPEAYSYLLTQKNVLAKRDKGMREYEVWYAYGRRQSMDINAYKLFFPHISLKPRFIISEEKDLLFYNGIAIISQSVEELKFLKVVLESEIFHKYLSLTTKNYASGYLSMSKNYIKNFGVINVSDDVKNELLESTNPEALLLKLYGLD
ncbi:Eco57I restriction-modification methylase domain-containing protein [Sphingobacterium sp.]|uniref:HsdM family class I SAM-dependent methyltransferase n=1 Tax=Sphingobacterium sp. TaxID=341027 RepID=UPI002589F31D|nr:Eco57I restriction-modification methylase domain-containing protein [Sphingobacterium sp.]WET71830.1 MAG: Eco57I restriction-modification methylase domain-containing protein [Sphingobacterium sp.]